MIEKLVTILKRPHPSTLFLDQGTKTNNTINKLQEIYLPLERDKTTDSSPRMIKNTTPIRVHVTSPRVETIDRLIAIQKPHEIGTERMERFKKKVYREMVTKYIKGGKIYVIEYEDGDDETMNYRQVNRYE